MTHRSSFVRTVSVILLLAGTAGAARAQGAGGSFTMEQVLGYPFPTELVAARSGARVAWVFDERGVRNVYVADGPDWKARRVTPYTADDGQEITSLQFAPDGRTLVYVRGGDHDSNWEAEHNLPPDPASSPVEPTVAIWNVSVDGGAPKQLAEGDEPTISPKGDRVAFIRDRQVWWVPLDGSHAAARLLFDRGEVNDLQWSPDGNTLAFVTGRGDHSFIALFTSDSAPVRYLAPSTSYDASPRWSPDGSRIAFVRRPGSGGAPEPFLELHPQPWAIWSASVATGEAHVVWSSPVTLHGSFPQTDGRANLHWAAGDRLVFLSDVDGWPHLYSVPERGGEPTLLTPGMGMAEYITISADGRTLIFAGNMGHGPDDLERRHVFAVPTDRAEVRALTTGTGIEWSPVFTGDGSIALISATPQRPPLPAVVGAAGGAPRLIGADHIPGDFPTSQLVTPRAVTFRAPDGVVVHGQLFERPGGGRHPAMVFVHGGPPRQMLLGWHYMDYYSNSYAVNQYLAAHGFVVLSVNYRLGIGYGHDFHHPAHAGPWGASEYQDVKAGAEYLRTLAEVDGSKIGIWGGSYGGFLTAMALAHNSDLFAAGVDMHGVHDWTASREEMFEQRAALPEPNDADSALKVAWRSSPDAAISTWHSPVLLIQGDDDRNVRFHQTVDLARRLSAAGVSFEEMVIPNEIHGFLRYASWVRADSATVAYLSKKLGQP